MKNKMMIFFLATLLMFIGSGVVMANDIILDNRQWQSVNDNMMAMTLFGNDPYAGKEGVAIGVSCHQVSDGEFSDNVIFIVGDKGSVHSDIANALNRLTSDESVLNNEKFGLSFIFSDGSSYVFQIVKANENFNKGVTISTIASSIRPEMTEKLKKETWVNVQLLFDGNTIPMFKPFSLDGSMASINKIESCYPTL